MNDTEIFLKDIWPIENVSDYKVHFGRSSCGVEPLNEWVKDRGIWMGWQQRQLPRNQFNREFIFSVMNFYHEVDAWLFGGVFRVVARHDKRYEVELTNQGEHFIGRLKLHSPYRGRTTQVKFENHYNEFQVREVLGEPYTGKEFPGYENTNIRFDELTTLIHNERRDWKTALQHVQGVYMITDTSTNKRYIGSAYGQGGVWGRWKDYMQTVHGGSKGLKALLKNRDAVKYGNKNFVFTLLEYHSMHTPDTVIIAREQYWKQVLRTQGKDGLNEN